MPYVLALRGEPELEAAFFEVIAATDAVKLEAILADQLQSLGFVNLEGDRACPACELYTRYLLKYLGQKSIFLLP